MQCLSNDETFINAGTSVINLLVLLHYMGDSGFCKIQFNEAKVKKRAGVFGCL